MCCMFGLPTGIHRALPIALCGVSPSPAISQVLSTTTTFKLLSSASMRAISLRHVVFPTPGFPIKISECFFCAKSTRNDFHAIVSTRPCIALPTRTATPSTFSGIFIGCVIRLTRWSVPVMPLRLVIVSPSSSAPKKFPNIAISPSVQGALDKSSLIVAPVHGSLKMHSGSCPICMYNSHRSGSRVAK